MQPAQSHTADDEVVLLLIDASASTATSLEKHIDSTGHSNYVLFRSLNELNRHYSLTPSSVIVLCCEREPDDSLSLLTSLTDLCPQNPILVTGHYFQNTNEARLIAQGATDYISLEQLTDDSLIRAIRYCANIKKHQAEVAELKNSDALTSLNNRNFFYRLATQKLGECASDDPCYVVISIDLDGFWRFNTRKGHAAGDQVILEFSRRILSIFGDTGLVSRIGQDEFAVLFGPGPKDSVTTTAKESAIQLMTIMGEAFQYDDSRIFLPCSIGIATTHSPSDLDTLLKNAGLARLSAKKNQTNSYVIYDQLLRQTDTREYELEPDLANALRGEQFELYLQPQIAVSSGQIIGAEALIRWNHPKQGLVMPGEFIELCERNGMIIPIGYWAIHTAGLQLKEIQAHGFSDFRLSVNLSFRQFQDIQFANIIKRIVTQNDFCAHRLNLELTESALMRDEQHVSHCLDELSELNVKFSLDDFGTGYSSFSLLQKLPIHALKIDRCFIRDIAHNANDAEIVRVIINLAKSLDKEIVAEGVETEEQLNIVRSLGCDLIQGYYYSPAVPLNDFIELLKNHNG